MIKECYVVKTGILFDGDPLRDYGLDPAALEDDPTKVDTSQPINSSVPAPIIAEHQPVHVTLRDIAAAGAAFALQHGNDYHDAIATVFDQLSLAKFWWGLELIPLLHTYQQEDGTWMRRRS